MKATHKLVDVLRLGLHSLTIHRVRSALTVLGILFGVWSVIAMLAINAGGSYEAQKALRQLGSTNIIINSVKPAEGKETTASGESWGVLHYGLKRSDVRCLRDNIPGVIQYVTAHRQLKYAHHEGRNIGVTVIATEPAFEHVARTRVIAGRFITHADMLRQRPCCLVTASLGRRLFGVEDPLGKSVLLQGDPFTVVGVFRNLPAELAAGATDVEKCVLVPMSTAMSRFGELIIMSKVGGETLEKVEVSQCILRMQDEEAVIQGAGIARSILHRIHDDQDYEVKVPLEIIEQIKKQRQLWNFMFLTIASVSLLVGGIGIMNIMLASVTERTREIGIRRALGAKQRDIVAQFLIEAVALTTVGGLLGVAIGVLVPWGIEKLLKFTTIVSPLTLALPFMMAVAVGLISGLYPALRASKLDPIVALRHE